MKTLATLTMTVLFAGQAITADASAQVQGDARSRTALQVTGRPTGGSLDADAVLRATTEAGLPEAPVRRTLAEGEAKGASEGEVARAALKTHGRLLLAREALESAGEQKASHAEITLGAEALLRGASRADLERIRGSAPDGRSLETSLQAMLSLQADGRGAGEASSAIAAQLAAGASDVSLAALAGLNAGASAVAGALHGAGGGLSVAGSLAGSAAVGGGTGASATSGVVQIGAGVVGSLGVGIVP